MADRYRLDLLYLDQHAYVGLGAGRLVLGAYVREQFARYCWSMFVYGLYK